MRFRLNRHEREDIVEELEGRVLRRLANHDLDGPTRRRLVAEIICEEAQDIDHSVYDAKWGNKQLFLENIADDCETFDHDEDDCDEYFAD